MEQESGRSVLSLSIRLLLSFAVVVANVVGAAVVLVLAAFVLPRSNIADPAGVRLVNVAVLGAFFLVAIPLGIAWGRRRFVVGRRTRDPDRRARTLVLAGPKRIVQLLSLLWFAALVLFAVLNVRYSPRLAFSVSATIVIGGICTCAMSYLLAERILRRTAARVLSGQPPKRRRLLTGVMVRTVGFWVLGTAVPVIGLMVAGLVALLYGDTSATQLAIAILSIGGAAIGIGLLTTIGAEMVGGAEGLGNRLTYYSSLIRMPQFFAIILILAIIGISIYVFFFWLGKMWASWEA